MSRSIPEIYKLLEDCEMQFSTDTRNISEGGIFFALKGANFNGNKYAVEALKKGAAYALVDQAEYAKHKDTILVDNVQQCLQDLANYHRRKLDTPIIGITGSNGKTTTKELLQSVLSQKYNVLATLGNFNNHLGVPFTLLRLRPHHELAIVEMGANHQKEIAALCKIAEPNFAYITNFGKAHLEGFGGVEGVIKGKSELYDYMAQSGGICFVNSQDPIQVAKTQNLKRITFGEENSDYHVTLEGSEPFVKGTFAGSSFSSHLSGDYNFSNICAAATAGNYFELSQEQIVKGIEEYIPENNRSQWVEKGASRILLDAYNANPSSMGHALSNFSEMPGNGLRKVAVLGDMFELGEYSKEEHKKVIEQCLNANIDEVHFLGNEFAAHQKTFGQDKLSFHEDFETFADLFKIAAPSLILIKGSRGMRLERALDLI